MFSSHHHYEKRIVKTIIHFSIADTSISSVELPNDEECDATDDHSSTIAGYKKSTYTL